MTRFPIRFTHVHSMFLTRHRVFLATDGFEKKNGGVLTKGADFFPDFLGQHQIKRHRIKRQLRLRAMKLGSFTASPMPVS